MTPEEFDAARAAGEFAESAEVHGRMYGTLKKEVDQILASGRHVIMDIDVQGARQFVDSYPESVLIFIIPPSAEVLLARLNARGTETPESLARRMRNAIQELRSAPLYGYLVVNEGLEEAVQAVSSIIDGESFRLSLLDQAQSRIGAMVTDLESELDKMNRRD
jgi:guanylate kinase